MSPTLADLEAHILNDATVNAAITQAVHRFYYDKCFSPYTERPYDTSEVKVISKIMAILSTKNAGWRNRLRKTADRYHGWEPTNALSLACKPL